MYLEVLDQNIANQFCYSWIQQENEWFLSDWHILENYAETLDGVAGKVVPPKKQFLHNNEIECFIDLKGPGVSPANFMEIGWLDLVQ